MTRTLAALSAAAIIGIGTMAAPRPASALAEWVIPTIIAASVGGIVIGSAAQANRAYAYGPGGAVYVDPAPARCRIVRERTPSGALRRVQVCR